MPRRESSRLALPLGVAGLLILPACSSSRGTQTLPPSTGLLTLAATGENALAWAQTDVRIQGVSLVPQGGGAPVTVLDLAGQGLPLNLATLGHAHRFLGSYAVPVGTYTGATVILGADALDLGLTAGGGPSPDFGYPAMSSFGVFLQGASGSTATRQVDFGIPLEVATGSNTVLDLAWDTLRPTFLGGDGLDAAAATFSMDLDGVLRRRPVADCAALPLIPVSGVVYDVAPDNRSFHFTPTFSAGLLPTFTFPRTLTVKPDSVHGMLFMDVDTATRTRITDLASVGAALPGRPVRVGGQLQADGSFLATRLWAGTGVFSSTELHGHVTRVELALQNPWFDGDNAGQTGFSMGSGEPVADATDFTVLNPANPGAASAPVATGTSFLTGGLLPPGTIATTVTAYEGRTSWLRWMDIVSADFTGPVTDASGTAIRLAMPTGMEGSVLAEDLPYLSPLSPSGTDFQGGALQGFHWWRQGHPDQITAGAGAPEAFAAAAAPSVDFGGAVGALASPATVHGAWADAANPAGWSAQWAILGYLPLPVGSVGSDWAPGSGGGTFGLNLPGGTATVPVDVPATAKVYVMITAHPGPLVYVTPVFTAVDPGTAAGQGQLAQDLAGGKAVQVFGYVGAGGRVQADLIFLIHYTG